MKNTYLILAVISGAILLGSEQTAYADDITEGTTVHFRQGKAQLDTAFYGNEFSLRRFISQLNSLGIDSLSGSQSVSTYSSPLKLKNINIFGAASPEGPVMLNRHLSEKRAHAIYDYVASRVALPDSLISYTYMGRDWNGLRSAVETDTAVPARNEVLTLLNEIVETATPSTAGDEIAIERLQSIDGGAPYRYLYSRLYPALRESGIEMHYLYSPEIDIEDPETGMIVPEMEIEDIMVYGQAKSCKPFYMALKTNMLYDALALPNIGAEFYLGKNISIVGNWMYGWWDKDSRHRYWRAYGGDLAVRWWFGRHAHQKPLTGHHIGIYGGVVTYDFEFGGRGYMGGLPGKTLWDRCNRFAGIEYGYSLPIARRLNLDFTIGIGYFGGKYLKYDPRGDEYVWKSTHELKWFGPTKAEVSLVWLIGCNNYNRKGGIK